MPKELTSTEALIRVIDGTLDNEMPEDMAILRKHCRDLRSLLDMSVVVMETRPATDPGDVVTKYHNVSRPKTPGARLIPCARCGDPVQRRHSGQKYCKSCSGIVRAEQIEASRKKKAPRRKATRDSNHRAKLRKALNDQRWNFSATAAQLGWTGMQVNMRVRRLLRSEFKSVLKGLLERNNWNFTHVSKYLGCGDANVLRWAQEFFPDDYWANKKRKEFERTQCKKPLLDLVDREALVFALSDADWVQTRARESLGLEERYRSDISRFVREHYPDKARGRGWDHVNRGRGNGRAG